MPSLLGTPVELEQNTFEHTLAFTLNAGSDRIVYLLAVVHENDANTSATYGGVSMTKGVDYAWDTEASPTEQLVLFYLEEANLPANGSNDFVFSNPGSSNVVICGFAFEGLRQTTLPDVQSGPQEDGFSDSERSLSITPNDDNSLILSVIGGDRDVNDWTHGGGQTELVDLSGSTVCHLTATYEIQASAANEAMTHTPDEGVKAAHVVTAWSPAAGAAATIGPLVNTGLVNNSLAGGRGLVQRSMEKINGIWRHTRLVVPVGIELQGA